MTKQIYLDNAATTLVKPRAVGEAVHRALTGAAGYARGSYAAAQRAGEAGIACCIMCGDNPSSLYTLLDGKSIGTLFG